MLIDEQYALTDQQLFAEFMQMCQDPQATQEKVLDEILRINAQTIYGTKHHFSQIKSSAEFCKNIPIIDWDDIKDLSAQMEKGKTDQLFAGETKYFLGTSGTTGKAKFLPESDLGAKAKAITSRLRKASVFINNPNCMSGKFFPIANRASVGKMESGIPYGSASGATLMESSSGLEEKIAFPVEVLNITDQEALDYTLMRFSIEQDVSIIVGNNAGRMESLISLAQERAEMIIRDIELGELSIDDAHIDSNLKNKLTPNPSRAQVLKTIYESAHRFTPAEYWPNLSLFSCWLGGSVGRYLDAIKPLLNDNVQFFDFGYGASEGKFNIPMENNKVEGPLSLLGAYYEFEPLDDSGDILKAHEIQDGEQYGLIITTFSGLYRYRLHDIVEVNGFTHKTPNIKFLNKTKDIGNICGEKMSGQLIVSIMQEIAKAHQVDFKHFCAVADSKHQRYDICIESDATISADLLSVIDAGLEQGIVYRHNRKLNLLNSPRLIIMKEGWQQALYDEKTQNNISIAQIKLPVIYDEIPLPEYISDVYE